MVVRLKMPTKRKTQPTQYDFIDVVLAIGGSDEITVGRSRHPRLENLIIA